MTSVNSASFNEDGDVSDFSCAQQASDVVPVVSVPCDDVVSVSHENDVSCEDDGVTENLSNAVAARPNREPDQPSVPTVDAENDLLYLYCIHVLKFLQPSSLKP